MTRVQPAKSKLRFRLYFWLMDLCLFFAAIGFVDHVLGRMYDLTLMPEGGLPYMIFSVLILIFNFIMPPFLILARFMRDEYTNQLWHRSITVLVYTITVIPFFAWAGIWIHYAITGNAAAPGMFAILDSRVDFGLALIQTWFAFTLLFVTIFQVIRWRDSR